jgi:uncharacterized protein YecT (DUF1311 family)
MKRIHSFVVAVVLGHICSEAYGQTPTDSTAQVIRSQAPKGITGGFYACIEEADLNSDQLALGACVTAERKVQDNRLNAVYKSVLGKLNGQEKEELIIAQRAWLEFHQKSAGIEFPLYGVDSDSASRSGAGFEVGLQVIFRLCERANTLDRYASLASDR